MSSARKKLKYGDVIGVATLEDILEEIVGEFSSQSDLHNVDVQAQEDGSFILDGAANIRDLNRILEWHLPSDGPKTINGLITEALESIPESPVCLKIGPYRLEIIESSDNRVKAVRAWQAQRETPAEDEKA